MIILTTWRTDEKEYSEKGNLKLSKEEVIRSLVDLNADELRLHFKKHTKIRQRSSKNGRWVEDDLDTTDTAFLTTIIEEDLRPVLSGREVWDVIAKLLKIGIVVYAPFDIIDYKSEDFRKLFNRVKPVINDLDPMGLMSMAPEDEYSDEIGRIVGLLTVAKELVGENLRNDDLAYIISGVFSNRAVISDEDRAKCATAMLKFLQEL